MTSRAERRREARAAQKAGPQQSPNPPSQRRLGVSLLLLFFFCASLALVVGGKLWVGIPWWLAVIGWTSIAGMGLWGVAIWRVERKHFSITGRWALWMFFILTAGTISSYLFVQSIRNIHVSLEIRQLKSDFSGLIQTTEGWNNTAWSAEECKRNLATHPDLVKRVLDVDQPPSIEAFKLLMAVDQVAYIAGCDIDFDSQAKRLLDEDKRWRTTAPWQYSALRAWANQVGWPRNHVACQWEVARAELAGKSDVAKKATSLCAQLQADKLSPWNGGKTLIMAEKIVEMENKSRQDIPNQQTSPDERNKP